MANLSEVLLTINEVLSGYDSDVKKAGPKVTTLQINGKERVDIREDIIQKLKKAKIDFEQTKFSESTFVLKRVTKSFRFRFLSILGPSLWV